MDNNGSQQSDGQFLITPIFQGCLHEFEVALEEAGIIQSEFFGFFISQLFNRTKDGITNLMKENDQNREEINSFKSKLEAMRQAYEGMALEHNEQADQLKELVSDLEQRRIDVQGQMAKTKDQLKQLQRCEEENKGERDILQSQIEKMRIKINNFEQQKLFLEREYLREYEKRQALEEQLIHTQEALSELQKQFWEAEGNRQSLSRSLERNKEELQQLRHIVEESEYLSSLSPLSKQKPQEPFSEQQQQSFNSQQQRQTIEEDIVIRLSQTHLPLYPPEETLQLPPKCQRPETASQHKPIRKMPKSVQSHQKPKKQESKQGLLSKAQNKQAVRSQLGSIFKDRLKYRSEHDQEHQQQIEKLKEKVKQKQQEKNKLMAEVAILKSLKTEPVLLPGPSREGLAKFRAENQELRRIARELTIRKGAAEQRYQQEKERCDYYKSQHRKIYEKLLLRQAESALLQQQLSLVEQQESSRVDQSEIFDDLSQRFNSLVHHHEVEQPSFRSGAELDPRCYYSIQNSMQMDQAGDSLTVQNHKQVPIKLCESLDSPAKALPSEESKNIEQLFLQGIEEIAYQPQQQPEVQTQRLLLSELMQHSRKQNSFTQCQLMPTGQPRNPLEIISLGSLAEYIPIRAALSILQCQSLTVPPHQKRLAIHSLQSSNFTKNKRTQLEICKLQTMDFSIIFKQSSLQIVQLPTTTIYPSKVNRHFQFTQFDIVALRPSVKIDFESQFTSLLTFQSSKTEIQTAQTSSNTPLITFSDKQIQINQELSCHQVNTDYLSTTVGECNTQKCQTTQTGVNSKQIYLQHTEINTETSANHSTSMITESIILTQSESQTNSIILVDTASQISANPLNDEGSNTDYIIMKQMGIEINSSQRLKLNSCILDARFHPQQKLLSTIQLENIIIQGTPPSKDKWRIEKTINQKITQHIIIRSDIAINTNNVQVICAETNTIHPSIASTPTQHMVFNSSLKTQKCIDITIPVSQANEFFTIERVQDGTPGEKDEQIEEAEKDNQLKLNIPSFNPPTPVVVKDQSYFIPISSHNTSILSPRLREMEENQINSSRTRDSSTQLRHKTKKSPSKIKKGKEKKRRQNEGVISMTSQIDISLSSINSENPSSQQSFTKSKINSKPIMAQQKTAAQTPCLQKEGVNSQDDIDILKWKIIRQYFYMLKQMTLISSNRLEREKNQFSFKNWLREFYIFTAEKQGEKSYFALWRGRLLRISSKAPQMLQLKQQKRFLSATGQLFLGNSEVVITNSVLQIKRSRKQRIFRGQMAEGEWKLLHARTYQLQ